MVKNTLVFAFIVTYIASAISVQGERHTYEEVITAVLRDASVAQTRSLAPPVYSPPTSKRGTLSTTIVTPAKMKQYYNMSTSKTAGSGKTIAIVEAYRYTSAESDLSFFSFVFGLPSCTVASGCLQILNQQCSNSTSTLPTTSSQDWTIQQALDLQWAHAIAPGAKLVLVEADSNSWADFARATACAASVADYVCLNFIGPEANTKSVDTLFQPTFDTHDKVSFFAPAGDGGIGVSYPAVSPNVIAVGGTEIVVNSNSDLIDETAWSGSNGGCSTLYYANSYQKLYSEAKCGKYRAVPDVAYDASPNSGVFVYATTYQKCEAPNCFWNVGGTSLAATLFTARSAVRGQLVNAAFVYPSNTYITYRDITTGANSVNSASAGYDLVTGLGSWIGDSISPTVSPKPTISATTKPTAVPTEYPTDVPSEYPTEYPTDVPTDVPTEYPTAAPTEYPTDAPTEYPTDIPTEYPTDAPTEYPTDVPTEYPTVVPTDAPTEYPTDVPTDVPTDAPTQYPTDVPTDAPTISPTSPPTAKPSKAPTAVPSKAPTAVPTSVPTRPPVSPASYYRIKSALGSLYMDLQNGATALGTKVVVADLSSSDTQYWRLTAEGYIQNKANGYVLDISGGIIQPGTSIIVWSQKPMAKAINQLWNYNLTDGTISSLANNALGLDVKDNIGFSGQLVNLWTEKTQDNLNQVYTVM